MTNAVIERAKAEATHAFRYLRDSGTLAASLTFSISQRIDDMLANFRFPAPFSHERDTVVQVTSFADATDHILNEARLQVDTVIYAHTPYLAAWSHAHRPFPILYAAAQRHLLAREIPVHVERERSVLDIIKERLDRRPDLAPPPGVLEANGGANFWSKGITKTAELVLLLEEAAKIQAISVQLGGKTTVVDGVSR